MSTTAVITKRYPALASPNFRLFLAGQFLSLVGTWMQNTTQPYLAYRITGQPIYLGLIGFAASLPALLFMLPGGVLVERLDKRKAVIFLQAVMMLQALLLGVLALSGVLTIWHIIVLAFVLGLANAFEITARQAMLIELVGKEALPNAIALNSTIFNMARVLGPALVAPMLVLLSNGGEGWAFIANGISYLFVIISLFFVHTDPTHSSNVGQIEGALQQFREGQRYIRGTLVVAVLILMAAVPGFFGFPAIQQVPVFARDVFHQIGDTDAIVAARNSGMLTAQGVGALIASVALATFSMMRRKGLFLIVGQFVFSLALMGLAFTQNVGISLPLMMGVGFGTVTALAMTNTLIQLLVPNHLRGRVISTYLWALQGVAPFGSLFMGWMAQTFGAPTAVLTGGLICLALVIVVQVLTPAIRQLRV